MNRTILPAGALLLALAGCGQREMLKPPQGASLPPKPALAANVPTSDALLTPRTEERPLRTDELFIKSIERADDRFDIPPPG